MNQLESMGYFVSALFSALFNLVVSVVTILAQLSIVALLLAAAIWAFRRWW